VPGPKSIKKIAIVPTSATAAAMAAGSVSLLRICIHLGGGYLLNQTAVHALIFPLLDKLRVSNFVGRNAAAVSSVGHRPGAPYRFPNFAGR
jgi:hypothetical protein